MKFLRATSRNLPFVDFNVFLEYLYQNDCMYEAERKPGHSRSYAVYGDNAVGWVQVKRYGFFCTVKAKISPQYRTHRRYYSVKITIDERHRHVTEAYCSSCSQVPIHERMHVVHSSHGCKHIAVLLKWLNKRSEEPRSSVVTIYCVRPFPGRIKKVNASVQAVVEEESLCHSLNGMQIATSDLKKYTITALLNTYNGDKTNATEFLKHVSDNLNPEICDYIERETRGQSESSLWRLLRRGRITASVIFEVFNCKKSSGIALNKILSTEPTCSTKAMRRGHTLEDRIRKEVERRTRKTIHKCGLVLNEHYPAFGATPDGIGDDFVLEIKCPTTLTNAGNYIINGAIKERYKFQVQLQMLMTNKNVCYFAVADPSFETNNMIELIMEPFDYDFTQSLLDKGLLYWNTYIFPEL